MPPRGLGILSETRQAQNWFCPAGPQWSAFFGPPMLTIKLKVTGLFNFNNVKLTWGGRTGRKWARSLASWLQSRARFSSLSRRMVRARFFFTSRTTHSNVALRILSHGERKKVQWPVTIIFSFSPPPRPQWVRFARNLYNYGTSRNATVCSEISSVSQSVYSGAVTFQVLPLQTRPLCSTFC